MVPPLASAHIQYWALLLGGYDYTISYKPGQLHANADMLSQLPSLPASPSTPSTPETVLLMDILNSGPVTAAQIRQWSMKDIVLAKVRDAIVTGNVPGKGRNSNLTCSAGWSSSWSNSACFAEFE